MTGTRPSDAAEMLPSIEQSRFTKPESLSALRRRAAIVGVSERWGNADLQSSRILGVAIAVGPGRRACRADGCGGAKPMRRKELDLRMGREPDRRRGSQFAPVLAGKTARVNLSPTISGHKVRVVLTNRFGADPVTIDDTFIGRTANGATLTKHTNKRLSFSGSPSVTIPPGEDVTSDAANFKVKAFQTAAVSVAVDPSSTAAVTHHMLGGPATFVGTGDLAATEAGSDFLSSTLGRPLVSAIQVQAGRRGGTVAAFGDSITEGFSAYLDGDVRYTDFLGAPPGRRTRPAAALGAERGDQRKSAARPGPSHLLRPQRLVAVRCRCGRSGRRHRRDHHARPQRPRWRSAVAGADRRADRAGAASKSRRHQPVAGHAHAREHLRVLQGPVGHQ